MLINQSKKICCSNKFLYFLYDSQIQDSYNIFEFSLNIIKVIRLVIHNRVAFPYSDE